MNIISLIIPNLLGQGIEPHDIQDPRPLWTSWFNGI